MFILWVGSSGLLPVDIVEWKEYFEDLIILTNTYSAEGAEAGNRGCLSPKLKDFWC